MKIPGYFVSIVFFYDKHALAPVLGKESIKGDEIVDSSQSRTILLIYFFRIGNYLTIVFSVTVTGLSRISTNSHDKK